jgi:hypothetical protein
VTDSKLQEYASAFRESGGYLNFASYGPPSRQVEETAADLLRTAAEGAVGASEQLHLQDLRARQAFSRLSGFPVERVGLLPYTSLGCSRWPSELGPGRSWSVRGSSPPISIPGSEQPGWGSAPSTAWARRGIASRWTWWNRH